MKKKEKVQRRKYRRQVRTGFCRQCNKRVPNLGAHKRWKCPFRLGRQPDEPRPVVPIQDLQDCNHPQHYGGDTIYEAIKVIEAWGLGFRLGNTVKYISRAGKKPGADIVKDLEKARWYLDREIEIHRRIEAQILEINKGV